MADTDTTDDEPPITPTVRLEQRVDDALARRISDNLNLARLTRDQIPVDDDGARIIEECLRHAGRAFEPATDAGTATPLTGAFTMDECEVTIKDEDAGVFEAAVAGEHPATGADVSVDLTIQV